MVEAEKKIKKEKEHPIKFKVKEMSGNGFGKVHYVGAWAVCKCMESCRRYTYYTHYLFPFLSHEDFLQDGCMKITMYCNVFA